MPQLFTTAATTLFRVVIVLTVLGLVGARGQHLDVGELMDAAGVLRHSLLRQRSPHHHCEPASAG